MSKHEGEGAVAVCVCVHDSYRLKIAFWNFNEHGIPNGSSLATHLSDNMLLLHGGNEESVSWAVQLGRGRQLKGYFDVFLTWPVKLYNHLSLLLQRGVTW